MRLIDADALLKRWKYGFDHRKSLEECIKTQPTAFDVEKVMAELEEWTFNADINIGDGTIMNHNLITSKNAIDIVRKGGVE